MISGKSSEESPAAVLENGGTNDVLLKINWKNHPLPCFLVASPTVTDIIAELTNYIMKVMNSENILLSSAFVDKLCLSFDLFCRLHSVILKDKDGKVITEKNKSRFIDVVHCGEIARFIQILETKIVSLSEKPASQSEEDFAEDLRIMYEACEDFFKATKRFFQEKIGFKFIFSNVIMRLQSRRLKLLEKLSDIQKLRLFNEV